MSLSITRLWFPRIFVEEEYSLEEIHLEEPCVEECVDIMPHDLELINQVFIRCPLKSIPTFIISPQSSLFHPSMDSLISTSLESELCMIYDPNLDWTHELGVTVGLEDWVKDLGFMPNLCFHLYMKHIGPYPLY